MNMQILYQFEEAIRQHLPSLNTWQAANVALFSYGVMKAESCDQNQVARQVALGEQVSSSARRWRRFLSNLAFPLGLFFEEWTRWVVQALGVEEVTLVVDETKIHDRIGVMMVGLAWGERCLPLAWRVYRANSQADYPPEGQVQMIGGLLRHIHAALPPTLPVTVLADRGLGTSPALCEVVAGLGWYYLFRVTSLTKVVDAQGDDYAIASQVQPGEVWVKSGLVFKRRGRVSATAIAHWETGYTEPWALVTNAPHCTGAAYAQRNWQEQAFRDLKSGGWQWGGSRIRQPHHVARLLVILTFAYVWLIAFGTQAVATHHAQPLVKNKDGKRRRHWSFFKEGLTYFVEVVQRYSTGLVFKFFPDPRL